MTQEAKKLLKYLKDNNIYENRFLQKGKRLIIKDEKKLVDFWNEMTRLFPNIITKKIEEFTNWQDFSTFFLDITEDLSPETTGSISYVHEHLNDSKRYIQKIFFEKYLKENEKESTNYYVFNEHNHWENEKWEMYILDTLINREIVTYLFKRLQKIIEPKFEYDFSYGRGFRKPMATSTFSISTDLMTPKEVQEKIEKTKNKTSYLKHEIITNDLKLPITLEELKQLDDTTLIELFYKGKIKSYQEQKEQKKIIKTTKIVNKK